MRLNKNIRQTLRIAKIELSSMFYSPVAWLILVIFALLIGYDYANIFDSQLHSQSLGNNLWSVSSAIYNSWMTACSEVKLEKVLHLKTGVNYLEDNNMLVSGEFIDKPDFARYNKVVIPEEEAYAANCIWVNDTVIVPEGYPTVLKAVQDLGYKTLVVDTSEFRKIDGGLSCLSLRF